MAGGGKNSFTFHRLTNLGGEVLANADYDDANPHGADHGAEHISDNADLFKQ